MVATRPYRSVCASRMTTPFDPRLAGDLRIGRVDLLDQLGRLDLADGPDGSFDLADDAAQNAPDDAAQDAADDAAFHTALDAALNADVGNLLFGDLVGNLDGRDELAGLEAGSGPGRA